MTTRSKRASSVGIALAFLLAPPLPDGTIGQPDRQHIAWSYSGISTVTAPPAVVVIRLDTVVLLGGAIGSVTLSGGSLDTISLLGGSLDTVILDEEG